MLVSLASEPAGQEKPNEDFIAATPNAVVLLDGVGAAGADCGCTHGVDWFVQFLGSSLLHGLTTNADIDLRQALADGIDRVAREHRSECDLGNPGTPASTVVLLRASGDTVDHLVLADSVLVLDVAHTQRVVTDPREDAFAQRWRAAMDATPNGSPEHDAALRQFLTDMREHRNQPDGFWVAAADPIAATQAIVGSVPAAELSAAAVLSDGATRLVDRFHLSDWPKLMSTLAEHGPAELIRQVRAAEHSDPRGERWKRGKATDDASAAYCSSF